MKHNFLVMDISELATTINKALYIVSTGRPGPVLIDIPKNITFGVSKNYMNSLVRFSQPRQLVQTQYFHN